MTPQPKAGWSRMKLITPIGSDLATDMMNIQKMENRDRAPNILRGSELRPGRRKGLEYQPIPLSRCPQFHHHEGRAPNCLRGSELRPGRGKGLELK